MGQLAFWNAETDHDASVVNVAQIPQRSPLRYPGGKTWLVPQLRAWLRSLAKPDVFIEPFTGGGIVSLTVAFEDLANRVMMIELDRQVAALWKTILSPENNPWLCQRVIEFDMTLDSLRAELAHSPTTERDLAFHTLIRNRTNHGGILAPGSGVVKHGESGKGIRSRWYPNTLKKRMENIQLVREKITFAEGDGLETIRESRASKSTFFFIDPPYTAAGKKAGSRLYAHNELDHEMLFKECEKIEGSFLMTYDNAPEIVEMAKQHGFKTRTISMKNTHHATMTELLIGNDLSWA
ncbi:MAG TPA: DNA adenine methylase [Candidatus Saccharimonadales bacterium]|jgi:DNA adenine methylase|nr:DNA adenine methylase [Candidatus Saccharimonadales bacterium]